MGHKWVLWGEKGGLLLTSEQMSPGKSPKTPTLAISALCPAFAEKLAQEPLLVSVLSRTGRV